MKKIQLPTILKDTRFLLVLILVAFFCREVYLATALPPFTGQDEARHYNTVQWLSENKKTSCSQMLTDEDRDRENLGTYRFSEEIRETSNAAGLSVWREENYRKPSFAEGSIGNNESQIQAHNWPKDILNCPPDVVSYAGNSSFFHWIGSQVERLWSGADVLTRFYLIRLLSVLFGVATVLLAYFASREARFSSRVGLLIALILSLQPRFSIYTTNINYDTLLIPCFALFFWAGLRYLNRGGTPGTLALLGLATIGAIATKGTGLVLLGGLLFLFGFSFFRKGAWWQQLSAQHWLAGAALIALVAFVIMNTYAKLSFIPDLSFSSLFEYLSKSIPRIPSSSENFWGTISWTEANHGKWFVYAIWLIEVLALYGLIRFFYQKENPSFLPMKRVALFSLAMIIILQAGIRLHDWNIFQSTGSLLLGTPGRYFIPTLLPQLILLAIGLGALLRRPFWLERGLIALTLIMLAFNLYTTWLIIIPRFYL